MRRMRLLIAALASLAPCFAQMAGPSWFTEGGASSGRSFLGGLGFAVPVPRGQEIFAEAGFQTGAAISQSSTLLVGVKSDYPGISLRGRKFTPFSIAAYGASVDSIVKGKAELNLAAIGTSAGFAQKYAGGFETSFGTWNIGVGISGDKAATGWGVFPFVFLSRRFGKVSLLR
jgi:hypothetical protein